MSLSVRIRAWSLCFLVLFPSLLSPLLTGCAGIKSTDTQSGANPPPDTPPDFCGAPPPSDRSFSNEYLYAGNLFEAPVLNIFKIDPTTGALTEMPWSPMQTFNGTISATTDASGKYLYLASLAPFGLNHQPIATLETYKIPGDDSQPANLGYIQAEGDSRSLTFDPQGKFFYSLDTSPDQPTSRLHAYTVGADAKPSPGAQTIANAAFPTLYAYKGHGNLLLFAHGTPIGAPFNSQGGITVYRQNCTTGDLSFVAENTLPDGPQFLSAPASGDLVVGWYCGDLNDRAYQYHIDSATGKLTPYGNNPIPALCETRFDIQEKYAIGLVTSTPPAGNPDTVAVYRIDASTGLIGTDSYTIPPFKSTNQEYLKAATFDAAGKFIFAATDNYLIAFQFDRASGKIKAVPGYPQPRDNAFHPLFIVAQ